MVMNSIEMLFSWSDSRYFSASSTRMLFSSSKAIDKCSVILYLNYKPIISYNISAMTIGQADGQENYIHIS